MNFLTPLYALAALAIAVPILFHLVRKRPKDLQTFSSLMFLEPAAPRLTQQSRIDNWLLLALRAAAIALLAIAFTRPYWKANSQTEVLVLGMRRIFLLDCSASMRRDGMMDQAKARIKALVEQSKILDTLSVYAFDKTLRPLLSLEMAETALPSQRQQLAIASLKNAKPTWNMTDLGSSLVQAADWLQAESEMTEVGNAASNEIVVVTDLQKGMKLEALANYSWPANTRVRVERIEPRMPGNAYAALLSVASIAETESLSQDSNQVRVRVVNSLNSQVDDLQLSWRNENDALIGIESRNSIPKGSSAVVTLAAPSADPIYLQLSGDQVDFDNKHYLATQQPSSCSVLLVESKLRENETSLGYFVNQIPLSTPARTVVVETREPDDRAEWPSPTQTPWIIAASELTERDLMGLSTYLEQGGHLLWVMDESLSNDVVSVADKYEQALSRLADVSLEIEEANPKNYSMFERIDFRHPVFADLADSRFNDFTKIKFWSHRKLAIEENSRLQILASFDDGSPAFLAKEKGKGTLWVLAAGWQPSQSQLALSSKFVPIISSLFRIAAGDVRDTETYVVGDEVTWTDEERIVDPLGNDLEGEADAIDETRFKRFRLREPGIYQRSRDSKMVQKFAVNMEQSESLVDHADVDCLERLGVNMADLSSPERKAQKLGQLQAIELEAQQGWWRWLVIGVLGVTGTESIVCIMRSRNR